MHRGGGSSKSFKGAAHRVNVFNVIYRELDNTHASVGNVFEQPLHLKLFEGLANRCMANAQFAGQTLLSQPLACTQIPLDNHVPQAVNDHIMKLFMVS